jgi:hypothetical protein
VREREREREREKVLILRMVSRNGWTGYSQGLLPTKNISGRKCF